MPSLVPVALRRRQAQMLRNRNNPKGLTEEQEAEKQIRKSLPDVLPRAGVLPKEIERPIEMRGVNPNAAGSLRGVVGRPSGGAKGPLFRGRRPSDRERIDALRTAARSGNELETASLLGLVGLDAQGRVDRRFRNLPPGRPDPRFRKAPLTGQKGLVGVRWRIS